MARSTDRKCFGLYGWRYRELLYMVIYGYGYIYGWSTDGKGLEWYGWRYRELLYMDIYG